MRNLISDPIDGRGETPTLVDITTGDQSILQYWPENLARSNVGIPLMENYDDERNIALTTAQAYPHTGSGITVWHTGADWVKMAISRHSVIIQIPMATPGNFHLCIAK